MTEEENDFYRLAKERAAAASEASMLRMLSGKTTRTPERAPSLTDEERSRKQKLHRKEYRERNLERFLEYERVYRERNRERLNAYHREYAERNREKTRAYYRERYWKIRDRILATRRERADRFLEYGREYREKNRDRLNALQRERYAAMKETLERRKAELAGREPFLRWALSLSDDDRKSLLDAAGRNRRLRRKIIKENKNET